ncbi:malectin domain-containing carbohydrate-binding protein [Segatella copri]|uniref:malectin domain-containing carbohydrate-binding protein n=1 Tax=Segatella copri TaxID=165179 RepID=UPI00294B3AAF|nr:malectin domain-containing carbohydrate-binding protein [Segatella copri]
MKIERKRLVLLSLLIFGGITAFAQKISKNVMQKIYDEVKTPYKYGMVVAPKDNYHQIDCPMVYREGGKWYMTYVVYNGKDGTDGRGYETWLATSDDLLQWKTLGRLLCYADKGWDMNQRAGYPALIDWTWNGSYEMAKYKGRHWMSYFGGEGTGYEAIRKPLNMGMASTRGDITKAHPWETSPSPVLSINDKSAQWWEKLTHYKSTVYWDKNKTLGKPFVMFYNAGGINPANQLKAERIGIALSGNMTSWRRLPLRTAKRKTGNPVFFHEAPGIITGDAQIVKFPHYYVMFYFSAYNPERKYNAYNTFAVSRDLVNWQDWEGTDLVYPSKPYDDMFAHKSYVLKHQGVVYHFYCAVNHAGQRGIAVATSVPMGRSQVSFPTPEKKGKRQIVSLNQDWQVTFGKTSEDSITKKMGTFRVNVPSNLDDYYGYRQLKHGNLHGTATYEKHFSVHKQTGKRYFLQLEGVGTFATVKVNRKSYPKELVGRTSFTLDISDALHEGDNVLNIKVEHPAMQTNNPWPCGGCSSEWGFSEGSQPFGIFRPVSLIETDEVRVEPFGVHVWNNEACDSVFVDTEVKNYSDHEQTIEVISKLALSSGKTAFRQTGKITLKAGETQVVRHQAKVSDAHLWSITDPYLYTLSSIIKREGKTIDDVATPFGIRTISWPVLRQKQAALRGDSAQMDKKDGRFYLNGSPVFINGTCDYEHLFGQSHAFSHEQIASRVKMMRQAGFNAFREAHQPHNLYYQQLLDEQGMLFWSQFSAHVWYDTSAFRKNFKRLLRRWIKERRNSPSVILWGIQNESVMPKDFTEECAAIIREMDPTAQTMRAITTCNGGEGSDWNVIQNWSGTYGGTADQYDQELKQPNQLLNGEYGAWRTLGFRSSDAEKLHAGDAKALSKAYTEDAFVSLLGKKAMLAESARDSVCGHFQWLFVSHENPGRVQPDEAYRRIDKVGPFNYKGLLTPWEQPTEGFYWYRNHYTKVQPDTLTPTAADRSRNLLKPAEGYTYLYRVNCGGDAVTDSYGSEWEQDDSVYSHSWAERFGMNPFTASQGHITSRIHGLKSSSAASLHAAAHDAKLFQYFRWGRHALNYQFAVPDGEYRVELYFAEPWLGKHEGAGIDCEGERIFDVAINDSVVVDDLDLWAEAGFAGACKKVVDIKVKGGLLTVSFPEVKVGEAIISAIAIAAKGEIGDAEKWNVAFKGSKSESGMSKTYWADLDKDVVEKYPKELLPQDNEVFPAVRYKSKSSTWTINPGVAREYMLRFRYKNTTGEQQVGRLKIVDSKGIVLLDRDMTFPETPNKFKTIGTTTDSQINAGTYQIILSSLPNVSFDYLEVQ